MDDMNICVKIETEKTETEKNFFLFRKFFKHCINQIAYILLTQNLVLYQKFYNVVEFFAIDFIRYNN